MTLILTLGGLVSIGILVLLARPLFRRDQAAAAPDREVAIYQDQLEEVERDKARGTLDEAQARAAKVEIERRLLGALRRREEATGHVSRTGRFAVIVLMASIPLAALFLYLQLGAPGQMTPPAETSAAALPPELEGRIAALEERLAAEPDNLEGFILLARTYAGVGDYEKAVEAYRRANRLAEGEDPAIAGEMAEALVLRNEGVVPREALEIFSRIAEAYPNDPQATYYLALAKSQAGDTDGALKDLQRLRQNAPPEAPWLPTVDALLRDLGATPTPAPTEESRAPGPTPEQMAAAQDLSDEELQQMVEGMVSRLAARLEENPDDLEGWRRLARAYEVLGRDEDAENAYLEVIERAPNDPAAKAFLDGRD